MVEEIAVRRGVQGLRGLGGAYESAVAVCNQIPAPFGITKLRDACLAKAESLRAQAVAAIGTGTQPPPTAMDSFNTPSGGIDPATLRMIYIGAGGFAALLLTIIILKK